MESRPITIEIFGRKIILKIPKNESDIKFIRSIQYARWNKEGFHWEIPHYPGNLELLKGYLGDRLTQITEHAQIEVSSRDETYTIQENQILIIRTSKGRLRLIFGFHAGLMKVVKTIPYYKWDSKNKCWTVPYSEQFLEEIKKAISGFGFQMIYKEEQNKSGVIAKVSPLEIQHYRKCPEEYVHKLQERRYSDGTIKAYVPLFEEFTP